MNKTRNNDNTQSAKHYHLKRRSITKQRPPKAPKQHEPIIEPRIAIISRTIYKTAELERLLNALRSNKIPILAHAIHSLKLDDIDEPTYAQLSSASGLSKETLKHNKEAIEVIKFAMYHSHSISNDTTMGAHTRGYMSPQTGVISYSSPPSVSTPLTNETFISLGNNTWQYGSTTFRLEEGSLIYNGTQIEFPNRTAMSPIERICISLGLPCPNDDSELSLDASDIDFKKIMYTLTTMALLDLEVIPSSLSLEKRLNYGKNVFELYLKAITGSGRIHSDNKYLRWINEKDTYALKSKLFNTGELRSYQSGISSMKYKCTPLMESIIKEAMDYLQMIDFTPNDTLIQEPLDFIIPKEFLSQIKLQDIPILLNDCIGYKDGFIIRPQPLDEQQSRIYSCFTAISSDTRKTLGFINYDIGAALQTICLALVKDPSLYPLHQELVNDKVLFRQKVMAETGNDLAWVKQELPKLNNQREGKQHTSPTLQAYYLEALVLRKDVINTVPKDILAIANEYAKPEYTKIWDKQSKTYSFTPNGIKESSLFIFIWTQYERTIREAMSECFTQPAACQHVHDAIYSKEQVNIAIIEQHVLKRTGFTVKISH